MSCSYLQGIILKTQLCAELPKLKLDLEKVSSRISDSNEDLKHL